MIEKLRTEIEKRLDWHYRGQQKWSIAHHVTIYGAAILSLVVATISQVKGWTPTHINRDSLIAIISLTAAILAIVAAKGGFERKWIANRMTRSKLDALRLDLLDEHADASEAKEALKRIISEHDAAITGAKPS